MSRLKRELALRQKFENPILASEARTRDSLDWKGFQGLPNSLAAMSIR